MQQHKLAYTQLPVEPLTRKFWNWSRWYLHWRSSVRTVGHILERESVAAVVATGGFVSGPAMTAAWGRKIPTALVNLDAAMGKANTVMARRAGQLFTVYDIAIWPRAVHIAMPLRRQAVGAGGTGGAKRQLGLDPTRPVLLVCGGSQGALSINRMMAHLAANHWPDRNWQLLHLCGSDHDARLRKVYVDAQIDAVVMGFCDEMAVAWDAADLAVSRAGAGCVAEAQANGVPTIFMPYPFHRDQHQKLNAVRLVDVGGAILLDDKVDPPSNSAQLAEILTELMADNQQLEHMADRLRCNAATLDGAGVIADWVLKQVQT